MSKELPRDHLYDQIAGAIALTTALWEQSAQGDGQNFTDSQVNAVFHRVIRTLERKAPKHKEPTSEKERLQAELYEQLLELPADIRVTTHETGEEVPVPLPIFLKGMRAAKEDLAMFRNGVTGERGYVDYALGFLAEVEADEALEEDDDDAVRNSKP